MKRSPLKRSTTPLRRTPIRKQSAKRAKEQRLRSAFVKDIMERRLRCEAGLLIVRNHPEHRCQITPVDVHEPLTRARGGSILDPDNALAVCRACHDWIHQHPAAAKDIGLLRSNYDN